MQRERKAQHLSRVSRPIPGLVAVQVISRDRKAMLDALGLIVVDRNPTCVAPLIDLTELGKCSGRTTLDHIKDQPRLGKGADSDQDHLVSLCEGHTERGAKAGYQWNTAHRPELRRYLEAHHV